MTQVNYAEMTDQELKQYFLAHRDDQAAFYAYMDRLNARPRKPGIKLDDPDWENKLRVMVEEKLGQDNS
uniref:Uncharacterized protein n=1 Tax=Cyanothece sp. (strain PCC 7425 / ATCC 29141) TaxID=395961 RepID=B8HWA4_CYAP4